MDSTGTPRDLLTLPEGIEWLKIGFPLIAMRLARILISTLIFTVICAVAAQMANATMWWVVAAVVLVFHIWLAWITVRRITAIRYALTEDELLVQRGRLLQSVEVIPYSRMQSIAVSASLTQRLFGIASVTLDTASTETKGTIVGLSDAEALRMRDELRSRIDATVEGL